MALDCPGEPTPQHPGARFFQKLVFQQDPCPTQEKLEIFIKTD